MIGNLLDFLFLRCLLLNPFQIRVSSICCLARVRVKPSQGLVRAYLEVLLYRFKHGSAA